MFGINIFSRSLKIYDNPFEKADETYNDAVRYQKEDENRRCDPPRRMASSFDIYKNCVVEDFQQHGWRVKVPSGATSMEDVGISFVRKGDAFNFIDELA